MIKTVSKYTEYIPLVVVLMIFTAEMEMDRALLSSACNMLLYLIIIVTMFICMKIVGLRKNTVLLIALLMWMVFIYLKRTYLPVDASAVGK